MPDDSVQLNHILHSSADVSRYTSRRPVTIQSRLRSIARYLMIITAFAQLCAVWQPLYSNIGRYVIPRRCMIIFSELLAQDPKGFVFVLMLLAYLIYRCYPILSSEETLLVMRSTGVQTTTRGTSRFIPIDEIHDIIIHEGFRGFEVRFFLAILLKNPADPEQLELEIVFPDTLPRRKYLERVWCDARKALFDK